MVEGTRHRERPEGLRLVPPRDALLARRGSTGSARQDPSLGVAHGCFWQYHPERAWTWELRLQDEIGPEFRIEEPPYRPGGRDLGDAGDVPHRDAFLRDQPKAALAAIEKEATRRMGRGKNRRVVPEMRILETGLWSAHAEALWEMELCLAERQGAEIRILAPDEATARATFEAAHPERVHDRKSFLASLVPPVELFDDEDADEMRGGRRVTTAAPSRPSATGLSGPVSAALEADLRSWVRRHGIVVWLDQAGTYSEFVERLQALRAAGALPYQVQAFRGSHLALMMALDGVAAGTEKAPLVIHLPGFTEETVRQTPLFELYAAGARYRKALDTLVTEAASGQVRPDQIDSFRAQPGMTLAGADAWLSALLDGARAASGHSSGP